MRRENDYICISFHRGSNKCRDIRAVTSIRKRQALRLRHRTYIPLTLERRFLDLVLNCLFYTSSRHIGENHAKPGRYRYNSTWVAKSEDGRRFQRQTRIKVDEPPNTWGKAWINRYRYHTVVVFEACVDCCPQTRENDDAFDT